MFTGIIEEVGTVKEMQTVSNEAIKLSIQTKSINEDIHAGDSISVNGICLTVTDFSNDTFSVDVMPETIKSSSLQSLKAGSEVNLERAMAANGRFGGHFVSGHVDGVGKIIQKFKQENAIYYRIQIPRELLAFLLLKGSIAVDGTSLTIFDIQDDVFTISLIPHTVEETIIGDKGEGDIVNIECDMLAKYVQNIFDKNSGENKGNSHQDFLKSNGFI